MHLIVIFGPPAVGKMTVGQALAARSGGDLRLLHNHMTIDLVIEFFDFGTRPFGRLVKGFRRSIVAECVAAGGPGLILTYAWALDVISEVPSLDEVLEPARAAGVPIRWVELSATLEERLERNRSANRLLHKGKTKSDIEASERRLLMHEEQHVFNTDAEHPFPYDEPHLRLEITDMAPDEAAKRIAEAFGLET